MPGTKIEYLQATPTRVRFSVSGFQLKKKGTKPMKRQENGTQNKEKNPANKNDQDERRHPYKTVQFDFTCSRGQKKHGNEDTKVFPVKALWLKTTTSVVHSTVNGMK
jgi:hypothetical protein